METSEHGLVEARILALIAARGPLSSICPSEVARSLTADREAHSATDDRWRKLLRPVRDAAVRLAQAGQIEVLRKGKPVDPGTVKGVIRLRAKRVIAGGGTTGGVNHSPEVVIAGGGTTGGVNHSPEVVIAGGGTTGGVNHSPEVAR